MNIVGASVLFVLIAVVLAAPTRWAWLGMVAGALYLTQGQQVTILDLNMYAMRFIEIAGFIRILSRGEFSFSNLNGIDRALLLLYAFTTLVFCLRSEDGQVYQFGTAVDALLCYFTFRGLCRKREDFSWFLRAFALLLVPYVALVMIECLTSHNPFTIIGGYGLNADWIRAGRVRAVATFRHPSLLGTLGASFLPLFLGLAFSKGSRTIAGIGCVLCLAIVWASNSGGPLGCALVGVVGWVLWRMRTNMRFFRRGLVALIVAAGFMMKAPIWYLLAKLGEYTGGDGWHRSYLMDMAYQNLDKWWLAGMAPRETASWFPYVLAATGAADMTNNYLMFGIAAGLGAVILFVIVLTRAYRYIGKSLAIIRADKNAKRGEEAIFWSLGVMLTVHVFNWFGITYFDQTYVFWFMQLAIISSLTQDVLGSQPNTVKVEIRRTRLMRSGMNPSARPQLVRPSAFRN